MLENAMATLIDLDQRRSLTRLLPSDRGEKKGVERVDPTFLETLDLRPTR
jgi:hypothetical protein